jgi:hypothetical protein
MERLSPRIGWHKPEAPPDNVFVEAAGRAEFAARIGVGRKDLRPDPTSEILMRVGVPFVEGAKTAAEYATGLLQFAAEIEQALMVQYLYAAVSAVSPSSPPDFRRTLVRVAIQEMAHLATVQNLLLLVGGPDALHMQRDVVRATNPDNPIPFVLRPVSRPSLAIYVAAEMPAKIPDGIRGKVDELVKLAEGTTQVALHRVGAIYAVLKMIFQPPGEAGAAMALLKQAPVPADLHLTDADLRPANEVARHEAQPDEWDASAPDLLLKAPHTAAEAVEAIELVSEQGEGFGDAVDSHFEQFLAIIDAFDAGTLVAKPLPISPNLGTGHGGEAGEAISHPYTKLWGEVFGEQYGLLVLSIYHALRTPRDGAAAEELRASLAELALKGMRTVILRVSDVLAALPLRPGDSGPAGNPQVPAGPPYDLDPAMLLPGSGEELAKRHLIALDRLAALYAAIEGAPEFASHPNHATRLANLRNYDKERRDLFSA